MISIVFLYVAFVGLFIISSLFTLLVASRKWHWFARSIVIVASVLPLALVETYDLLLILLVSQLTIMMIVFYEANRRTELASLDDRQQRRIFVTPKFSLYDLMLALVVVGVVMAILTQFVTGSFLKINHQVGIGAALGVWSLLGIAIFYWKVAWRKRLSIVLFAAIATLAWSALDDQWLVNGGTILQRLVGWVMFLSFIGAICLLMFFLFRIGFATKTAARDDEVRPHSTIRFAAIGIVTMTILILGTSVLSSFGRLLFPPTAAKNLLTVNEGDCEAFDKLSDIGRQFESSNILTGLLTVSPGAQLRTEIRTYSNVYQAADALLERESFCWLDWSVEVNNSDSSNLAFSPMDIKLTRKRTLCRAIMIRSSQLRHDGRFDDAIESGLQTMKLAQPTMLDGILITWWDGRACERMGLHEIWASLKNASKAKLQRASQVLREYEAFEPETERIIANEIWFAWQQEDWRQRLYMPVLRKHTLEPLAQKLNEQVAFRRAEHMMLRTSIALELYKREHNDYPTDLSQLVGKQLTELPLDPYSPTSKPLSYEKLDSGLGYRLYSVGKNRVDDNGVVDPNMDFEKGDIDFAEITKQQEEETRAMAAKIAEQEEN